LNFEVTILIRSRQEDSIVAQELVVSHPRTDVPLSGEPTLTIQCSLFPFFVYYTVRSGVNLVNRIILQVKPQLQIQCGAFTKIKG